MAHASSSTRSHILTPLQVRILAFVTVGATDEEIAEKLHISVQYVKNHMEDIFAKIGTSNRLQTTLWALGRRGSINVPCGGIEVGQKK